MPRRTLTWLASSWIALTVAGLSLLLLAGLLRGLGDLVAVRAVRQLTIVCGCLWGANLLALVGNLTWIQLKEPTQP